MSYARVYLPALLLFWAGLLFGVSFLATPVKFQAPSLSLAVGVDVGRYTFAWLNRIECVAAVILLALAFAAPWKAWLRAGATAVGLIVALETFWLLPVLDERAEIVIQGGEAPPSRLHQIYIALDLAELILLLALGFATLYAAARASGRPAAKVTTT